MHRLNERQKNRCKSDGKTVLLVILNIYSAFFFSLFFINYITTVFATVEGGVLQVQSHPFNNVVCDMRTYLFCRRSNVVFEAREIDI